MSITFSSIYTGTLHNSSSNGGLRLMETPCTLLLALYRVNRYSTINCALELLITPSSGYHLLLIRRAR
jgi:hypothetical protein